MEPLVSVIVPIKNRRECLKECLASVAQQTLKEWECLLVDAGSDDETLRMQSEMVVSDPRFRMVPRPSGEGRVGVCRNAGLAAARAPWVIFLDSDDILTCTALAERMGCSSSKGEVTVSNAEVFEMCPGDRRKMFNIPTIEPLLDRFLKLDFPWQTSGPTWPRRLLLELGGFDEGLIGWEDWELHLRALMCGVEFKMQLRCDYFYRLNSLQSQTGRQLNEFGQLCAGIAMLTRVETALEQRSISNNDRANLIELRRRELLLRIIDIHGFLPARRAVQFFPAPRQNRVRQRLVVDSAVRFSPGFLRSRVLEIVWGRAFSSEAEGYLMKLAIPDFLASTVSASSEQSRDLECTERSEK